MPETTRRRRGELVRGVFSILLNQPDGLPAKTILEQLQQIVAPTAFELTTYPRRPDTRRYEKIVRFSTIGPVKAGWLTKDKGYWSLTDEGRKAYDRLGDPEAFAREADRLFEQAMKSRREHEEEVEVEGDSPDAATTLEEAVESAWSEIEEHLTQMNPYDSQNLVAGLLRGMGYHVSWVSPPGPDRGIDIIAPYRSAGNYRSKDKGSSKAKVRQNDNRWDPISFGIARRTRCRSFCINRRIYAGCGR